MAVKKSTENTKKRIEYDLNYLFFRGERHKLQIKWGNLLIWLQKRVILAGSA